MKSRQNGTENRRREGGAGIVQRPIQTLIDLQHHDPKPHPGDISLHSSPGRPKQSWPVSHHDFSASPAMVPAPPSLSAPNGHPGPHPSFIEVAKPYIFHQKIENYLATIGMTEAKEDGIRLQGVKLIDDVRKALQLCVSSSDFLFDFGTSSDSLQPGTDFQHSMRLLPQVPLASLGQRV